ncbi:hypothetical protein CPC08DRAFT_712109 [Agrocybe pediades]|nr:hypothetical protein CPC08DRAFT_712109 [Agrocybe pediades]
MAEEKEALSDLTPAPPPPPPTIPQHDPPAYDSLGSTNANATSIVGQDTWRRTNSFSSQPIALSNSNSGSTPSSFKPFPQTNSTPPAAPPARAHTRSSSTSSISSLKSLKSKRSWFNFGGGGNTNSTSSSTTSVSGGSGAAAGGGHGTSAVSSRKVTEVRTTVCGLIRNLVVGQEQLGTHESEELSPAALGILQSCAEACSAHSLSLSTILQEKFIESHSPLYWSIVKRPVRNTVVKQDAVRAEQQSVSLLDADDVDEPARMEDDATSHNANDLLGALLNHVAPSYLSVDTITELRQGCLATSDQSTFQRLRLLIPQFSTISGADQVLLGASKPVDDVTVEIGGGNEGAFAVNIKVPQFHKRMMISKEIGLEFVARNRLWRFSFMITPDNAWYGPPPGSWCVSISLQEPSPPTWFDARVILPNCSTPLEPSNVLRLKSKQMMEAPRNGVPATQIVVALDESQAFASLQYSGSSYIPADEKLTVRLEAKLRKPSQDSDECFIS